MRKTFLVVLALIGWSGCGGKDVEPPAGGSVVADAGPVDTGAGSDGGRVPKKHRPAGAECPAQRGPGWTPPATCPLDAGLTSCVQDAECASGANGRCLGGHFFCSSFCSYDDCSRDTDCAENVPCECRASVSASAANSCVKTSNCRVDGDCGPNGYCSPSQVGVLCFCMSSALCDDSGTCCVGTTCSPSLCVCGDSCGHGYYCHTPEDECVDDSDCSPGDSCNYDRLSKRWQCAWCVPPP